MGGTGHARKLRIQGFEIQNLANIWKNFDQRCSKMQLSRIVRSLVELLVVTTSDVESDIDNGDLTRVGLSILGMMASDDQNIQTGIKRGIYKCQWGA